jgi:prophage antirepressor-like protein
MTTNNELRKFSFGSLELRVLMQMAEPWFALADIRRVTGRWRGGGETSFLATDETQKLRELSGTPLKGHGLVFVSESGLYKLIMRSDKTVAKPFQDWVTREVLPSIRKTGGYLLNEEARDTAHADDRQAMPLPEAFAQAMAQVLEQNAEATRKMLEEVLSRLQNLFTERLDEV